MPRPVRTLTRAYTRFDKLFALLSRRRCPAVLRSREAARLHVLALEDRLVPDGRPLPAPVTFAGSGVGVTAAVVAYDAASGGKLFDKTDVFGDGFTGGVQVAAGDLTRDGYPDAVVAAGPGGGPRVAVLNGKTGRPVAGPLADFFAFDPSFRGGVSVAVADVDGDKVPDVIAAAGAGGGPRVEVFSGATGAVLADFWAFDPSFTGGVSVAAADDTGDGKADVAVGAGPGGGPRVRVFDLSSGSPAIVRDFFAGDPADRAGLSLGGDSLAGDVDGDGTPDLVTGSGPREPSRVAVWSGRDGSLIHSFAPYGPDMTAGVRVATAFVTADARADVVVGTGPGAVGDVRVFDGATFQQLAGAGEFQPFGGGLGGVSVAASNDPPSGTQIFQQSYSLTLGGEGGDANAGVTVTVYAEDDGDYLWQYDVTNYSIGGRAADSVYWFALDELGASPANPTGPDGWLYHSQTNFGQPVWEAPGDDDGGMMPGDSGTFTFETPPRPIALVPATLYDVSLADGYSATIAQPGPMPTINATVDPIIPVNANDDNGTKNPATNTVWKSAALPFIPYVRDFNYTQPLGAPDPQLKLVTVTLGGGYAGTLSATTFGNPAGTGSVAVKLWTDAKKSSPFTSQTIAAGTDPTTVPVYVEGTHESQDVSDAAHLHFTFTVSPGVTVTKDITVLVGPYITSFTNSIPSPSVTWGNPAGGVSGLAAFKPGQNGAASTPGITFTAQLVDGGLSLNPFQIGVALTNGQNGGTNKGAEFQNLQGSQNLLPNKDPNNNQPIFTFPVIDSIDANNPTSYPNNSTITTAIQNNVSMTTVKFWDSPSTASVSTLQNVNGNVKYIDVTYTFEYYVVVKYSDGSIYPVAMWPWVAEMFADQGAPNQGPTKIETPDGVAVIGDPTLSPGDPTITRGPTFKGNYGWR